MKKEYDFSQGKRGQFYNKEALFSMPLYIEEDVLKYFQERAIAKGIDVHVMINELLKRDISTIESIK